MEININSEHIDNMSIYLKAEKNKIFSNPNFCGFYTCTSNSKHSSKGNKKYYTVKPL